MVKGKKTRTVPLMICVQCRRQWFELPLDPYTELAPGKAWGGRW